MVDNYATDGQPGTLFEGEGIQYLLCSPIEGFIDITTKFTTDTHKTITPSFDPIFFCRTLSIGNILYVSIFDTSAKFTI